MIEMFALNATDVRKDWGGFIDSVVREKPKIIKRSRDFILATSLQQMKELLKAYTFTAEIEKSDEDTYAGSLGEIDIVEAGATYEEVIENLAKGLMEYSEDYYERFEKWYPAPNRKPHLPYVLNVLCQDDLEGVKKLINAKME